jgi:hypothetical protein
MQFIRQTSPMTSGAQAKLRTVKKYRESAFLRLTSEEANADAKNASEMIQEMEVKLIDYPINPARISKKNEKIDSALQTVKKAPHLVKSTKI